MTTLATPASGAAPQCETPCSLHMVNPPATASGSNELGIEFQADEPGWIAGICYWESPTETGNHSVTLWDSTGSQVATASGAGTPGTENCVDFNPPVAITPNTMYTASYTSNTAFQVDQGEFSAPIDIPPLHQPVFAGAIGAAGAFPQSNGAGDGYGVDVAFIDTESGLIMDCVGTLTAPTSPSAGPGSLSAAVSWGSATSDPPGCIAGYVVTPFVNGVAQTPTLMTGIGTTTVIKGLTNGQTYTFTVAAESGQTVGPASAPTAPVTVGAPPAPTTMSVTRVGRGTLRVAFKAPKRNNGSAINGYTATCKSSAGTTRSKSGKRSPLTVTNLTAGKKYTCTVKAANRRGNSPASRRSAAVKA